MIFRQLALCLAIGAAVHAAQTTTPPAPVTALIVSGDITTPLKLTPADIKAMPRTRVEVKSDSGTVTYEGVLVGEILKRAGAPFGNDLRGNALATYVVATASDGYQIVFSLGELENGMTKNDIMVADTADGKPLFAAQGPFKIVAPKDERPARSIRMLERLEIVRLKK